MLTDDLERVLWGPSFATGTRVLALSNRRWRAYLITDLTTDTDPPFTFTGGDLNVTAIVAVPVQLEGLDLVQGIPVFVTARGSTNSLVPTATDEHLLVLPSMVNPGVPSLGINFTALATAPAGTEQALLVRTINDRAIADSISISGTAVAPLAGATICTMTPGTAGKYEVFAHATIALGPIVAGDEANMALNLTAVQKQILPYTQAFGGPFGPYRFSLAAASTLNITAVANGTAGVSYVAGITCKRVS